MNKKGIESEKEGKKNLKSEKKIVYYKAARNVKKTEKICFLVTCEKWDLGEVARRGKTLQKLVDICKFFF